MLRDLFNWQGPSTFWHFFGNILGYSHHGSIVDSSHKVGGIFSPKTINSMLVFSVKVNSMLIWSFKFKLGRVSSLFAVFSLFHSLIFIICFFFSQRFWSWWFMQIELGRCRHRKCQLGRDRWVTVSFPFTPSASSVASH